MTPQETHIWRPSGGFGGPFLGYSEPQKLEEHYETCSICGAVRARDYFAGGIYSSWRYNINGAEGMYPCQPPHEHDYTETLPPTSDYPLGMERCSCGKLRQPTRRGGYRLPSVEEMTRYLQEVTP